MAVAAAEVVTTDGAEGGEAAWVWENQRGEDDDDGPAMALELGGLRGPLDEAVDMFAPKGVALVCIKRLGLRLCPPLVAFYCFQRLSMYHSTAIWMC